MKNNKYTCIVTGDIKYIPPSLSKTKIQKFGNDADFRAHYISTDASKLLRQGLNVNEVREKLGGQDLPEVDSHVLARLKLLRKKKGLRAQQEQNKDEAERYLKSQEFKDKMRAREERLRNMSFQDWVERYTGTGRERGGTCIRPDIFLSHNDKACDGCSYYEFCMCYGKRLSHEKRVKRK